MCICMYYKCNKYKKGILMERIQELRGKLEQLGIKQAEFARICGISKQQLNRWIMGRGGMNHDNFVKINKKLKELSGE